MSQIYNLLETIELDKKMILELEDTYQKKLNTLKSVLSAHEDALERLTSVPKVNPEMGEKLIEKSSAKRQRITLENWKELNIEVGDTVEIVVSGDDDFIEGLYIVTDTQEPPYYGDCFMALSGYKDRIVSEDWYFYNNHGRGLDEIYLIKG